MVAATSIPATANSGSGHQAGVPANPSPLGTEVKTHS